MSCAVCCHPSHLIVQASVILFYPRVDISSGVLIRKCSGCGSFHLEGFELMQNKCLTLIFSVGRFLTVAGARSISCVYVDECSFIALFLASCSVADV